MVPEKNVEDLGKIVEFPEPQDIPDIKIEKEAPEEYVGPTIDDVAKQMEEEGKPFPPEIEEEIRRSLSQMFSLGMSTGSNAISAVVYERIGNGKLDFEALDKEKLVEILTSVKDFCEVAISKRLLQYQQTQKGDETNESSENTTGEAEETGSNTEEGREEDQGQQE